MEFPDVEDVVAETGELAEEGAHPGVHLGGAVVLRRGKGGMLEEEEEEVMWDGVVE